MLYGDYVGALLSLTTSVNASKHTNNGHKLSLAYPYDSSVASQLLIARFMERYLNILKHVVHYNSNIILLLWDQFQLLTTSAV